MRLFFLLLLGLLMPTLAFASHPTGLVVPKDWKLSAPFINSFSATPLPDHYDWRDHVAKEVIPAIKNQGNCGSCWAHSVVSAVEWQKAIHGEKLVKLAPQELVSCDKTQMACRGGFFTALDYAVEPGVTYEKDFPYVGKNVACKANLPHDVKLVEWGYVGDQNRQPTVDEIRNAVITTGPVPVDMYADARFQSYKSGIFGANGCSHAQSNHMVLIIGWDMPSKSWIVQNSWGTAWGEKGYFRIRQGCNSIAGIVASVLYKE